MMNDGEEKEYDYEVLKKALSEMVDGDCVDGGCDAGREFSSCSNVSFGEVSSGELKGNIGDFLGDLMVLDGFECENTSSTCSLSPRAILALVDVEPILEAPEEFRSDDTEKVEIVELCNGVELDCDSDVQTTEDPEATSNLCEDFRSSGDFCSDEGSARELCCGGVPREKLSSNSDCVNAEEVSESCGGLCEPEHVSSHDHGNSCKAEVADTCGRAIDKAKSEPLLGDDKKNRDSRTNGEEDGSDSIVVGCELNVISRNLLSVENVEAGMSCGNRDEDNDHARTDYVDVHVGDDGEVMITTPPGAIRDDNGSSTHKDVVKTKVAEMKQCNVVDVDVTLDEVCISENNRCAEGRDAVNGPGGSSVSYNIACLCAGNVCTPPAVAATSSSSSIEIGVAICAQAPGCSRDSAAKVCGALISERSDPPDDSCSQTPEQHSDKSKKSESGAVCDDDKVPEQSVSVKVNSDHDSGIANLSWTFKEGRLSFDTCGDETERSSDEPIGRNFSELEEQHEQVVDHKNAVCELSKELSESERDETELLSSRNLNRRLDDSRSRLRRLEEKLKEAGITDGDVRIDKNHFYKPPKTNHDANQNILPPDTDASLIKLSEEPTECYGIDEVDLENSALCEFDVRHISTFSTFNDCDYFVVYDELDDSSEDEGDSDHCLLINNREAAMRGDGTMGIDGERSKQHNPDRDNLKSLLKKPGRGKDGAKKNRVVFNENKNEFFDADYIILIREECDYDEEDDDGVCTCNQHEMVRLTCCEPNCNCNYDFQDQTPQSPKFAPPLEFVDAVTLSPPEGYKDMELGEQQLLALQQMSKRGQRTAVCRECSATHDDEGEGSPSDNEEAGEPNSDREEPAEEKEKTDQSQQTTPTTPPADNECSDNTQKYLVETVTMTTVSEQSIIREAEDERKSSPSPIIPPGGSPISGILKGGRLWKQQSVETNSNAKYQQETIHTDSSVTSDEEGNTKRSVRFSESENDKRDSCDGAPCENTKINENTEKPNSVSPESTEMMLTFKLGNHVLISNNSLKPNSAVRQLFPCTKPLNKIGEDESIHQYLVTAESLRAFEEAKRSKLPQIIQSGEADDSIKKAIERNTLRRSLIRYEPRSKKNVQKTDNSLVERIKQLTCDVDDVNPEEDIPQRTSPPGEEARNSPEVNNKVQDKSFSPSSSSTASSNSSVSSTYKKITDLFAKREKAPDLQNNLVADPSKFVQTGPAPDLGNGESRPQDIEPHCPMTKINANAEVRKQFLSTLAPLTACVSGINNVDEYYYMNNTAGERISVASSVGTEYSLEDIDEGLKNDEEDSKRIAPDVLAGTPSASESGDELAMFVQQDASRIERIKKKYQPDANDEEDEHDDYGFNRRPSVRGIKPRFGSTTEILQQIQNQLQPPTTATRVGNQVSWPYYSESGLTGVDNAKTRNLNQNVPNYQYVNVPDDKTRSFYYNRPTTLVEENIYQNCTNQRCVRDVPYRGNVNHVYGSPVMRVGGGCSDYYQSLPRNRTNRPLSPPPLEVSKTYHQTMVYIPYNHIEGYQTATVSPNNYYTNDPCHRVTNQNQINKRYLEPTYHGQPRTGEEHYQPNALPLPPKQIRNPYPAPQPHLVPSRSESPLPGQFSTARSTQTQTAVLSTCNYYPRYRPMVGPVWQGDNMYQNKTNRHSFPAAVPRYPPPDSISLTDSESQHSVQMPNGYRQSVEISFTAQKESPTKTRFIERGVPEGAASVSPQDTSSVLAQSTSTMTSPTSPQNPQQGNPKPLFYAMNV